MREAGTRDALVGLAAALATTVLGTIIPTVFGAGQDARLIGMLAGGAVTAIITVKGPLAHVRTGLGVVAALAAIALTYNVGRAVDEQAFPPVKQIAPFGQHRPAHTTPPGGAGHTITAGGVAMRVDPVSLECGSGPDCGTITLTSVGTAPLKLFGIGFTGDAATDFSRDDTCDHREQPLATGETCSFDVAFDPTAPDGSARSAVLEIHQNVGDEVAKVDVSGTSEAVDALAFSHEVACEYADGALQFDLHFTGTPGEVAVTVAGLGESVTGTVTVAEDGSGSLTIPVTSPPASATLTLSVAGGDALQVVAQTVAGSDGTPVTTCTTA
jgi:hypothetical protein